MRFAPAACKNQNFKTYPCFRIVLLIAFEAALAATIAGCTTQVPYNPGPPPPEPQAYVPKPPPTPVVSTTGRAHSERASYYGGELAGHVTKSGETYDPDSLTAASKHLPIGSYAKVTNPTTGKSVVVRINDRGPHVRGRTLDLSERAAKDLGLTHKGVARVKVARISPNTVKAEHHRAASASPTSVSTSGTDTGLTTSGSSAVTGTKDASASP